MMRWSVAFGLALSCAVACGGSTEGDGSGGSSGSSGSGASGGASGSGGVGGSAGIGGGGSGGTAAGGAGGSGATGGSGAVANWDACTGPGQCVLFATNCCGGYCEDKPIDGWIPVNQSWLGVVEGQYCADPVACPGCVSIPHENFLAVCRNQKCQAIDLRTDELSACTGDAECQLRYGSGCCESCSGMPEELVAVSTQHSLAAEVCDPNAGACPPCAPPGYPPGALAQCIYGHCQVVWATDPGG